MAFRLGLLERVVQFLYRQVSDPQQTQEILAVHVDHAEITRQDFGIAEPEAVIAALGGKHEIIRQRRNLTQDLIALVAEQIGFVESLQCRAQEIPPARQQRLARNVRRRQYKALQLEAAADIAGWISFPLTGWPGAVSVKIADFALEHVRENADRVGDDEPSHTVADEGKLDIIGPFAAAAQFPDLAVDRTDDLDQLRNAVIRGPVVIPEINDAAQQGPGEDQPGDPQSRHRRNGLADRIPDVVEDIDRPLTAVGREVKQQKRQRRQDDTEIQNPG